MRPTISIIIPVYNVQDYLTSCIESIIKQDYKDYEAIFINDGSTDDSLEILKQYVKTDKRFKLISQKNSGLSSARNTGINQAQGKYITFIDSDDWISKNYVGALVYNAEKYDADIVSIKECLVYSNGKKVYKKQDFKILKGKAADMLFGFYDTNFAWGKLIKTSIIKDNNIYFPVGKNYEDIGTMYKIYDKAHCSVRLSNENYFYRSRESSITATRSIKDVKDKISFIKEMRKYSSLRKKYNYWDLYLLVKGFGAISDVYKVPNITKKQRDVLVKEIKVAVKTCKIHLRDFRAADGIDRALLVKINLAALILRIKHKG